ncbi:hypothetical protein A5787_14270 [Mycobacterium sp. 852002-50816_SCH5313054-b]|nr:hypothetical protein A5787_14270 [Mycobacterium sp. 852002-50816_SCH5313054-b]
MPIVFELVHEAIDNLPIDATKGFSDLGVRCAPPYLAVDQDSVAASFYLRHESHEREQARPI